MGYHVLDGFKFELTLHRILATLHLIAVSSALYYWLISNYANPEALATQNIWYVIVPEFGI